MLMQFFVSCIKFNYKYLWIYLKCKQQGANVFPDIGSFFIQYYCFYIQFVPTANVIDRANSKTELEQYGRKLRLMRHFRNDEKPFPYQKFRPKSTFNPRNKDTVIETYLSSLEERFDILIFLQKDLITLLKKNVMLSST